MKLNVGPCDTVSWHVRRERGKKIQDMPWGEIWPVEHASRLAGESGCWETPRDIEGRMSRWGRRQRVLEKHPSKQRDAKKRAGEERSE